LNNLVEQDHRGVKSRLDPRLGLRRFRTVAIAMAGVELLPRIKKGLFNFGRPRLKDRRAPAIWEAVLSA
jgi:transposase-like protein